MSSTDGVEDDGGGDGARRARRHVWTWPLRRHPGQSGDVVDGAVLAALRRGLGREPGTVPEIWPYYRELRPDGRVTEELQAEHLTLSLFGVHQQSSSQLVHRRGVEVGRVVAALRDSGRFSRDAVDRRFITFATATSLEEVETHLRGLVSQLRSFDGGALDYSTLFADLTDWQHPERRGRVQRRWGSRYFASPTSTAPAPGEN